ncbi:MAG: hypothetical protein WA667_17965 [Candidatus Nitrosopolaris sp.]
MVFTCPKCGQIFLHEMAYKTRSQRHLETRIGYGIFSTSNDNPVDLQRYVIESLRNVKEIKDLCSHVFDHHAPSGLNAAQPMNVENRVSVVQAYRSRFLRKM